MTIDEEIAYLKLSMDMLEEAAKNSEKNATMTPEAKEEIKKCIWAIETAAGYMILEYMDEMMREAAREEEENDE